MKILNLEQLADLVEKKDQRRPEEGRGPLYKVVLTLMRLQPDDRDKWEVRLVDNPGSVGPLNRAEIEAMAADAAETADRLGG